MVVITNYNDSTWLVVAFAKKGKHTIDAIPFTEHIIRLYYLC